MNSTLTIKLPSLSIIFLSLFIAAVGIGCGGGGGGTPAPTDEDAQGLYITDGNDSSATFKDANPLNPDISKTLTDIKGMIYGELPNQKFIFFDIATNVLYEGNITTITLTDFVGTATVYNDGVMVDNNVTVSGNVTTSSSIDMTLTGSGNFVSGSIKGLFSAAYNNVAAQLRISADVVNPWVSLDAGSVKMAIASMNTSNFIVESNSSTTMTTVTYTYNSTSAAPLAQCSHSGTLKFDEPKNIHPLSNEKISDAINCTIPTLPTDPSTFFTGFASVIAVDGAGIGTEMWYATTNGTNSIFMILKKL